MKHQLNDLTNVLHRSVETATQSGPSTSQSVSFTKKRYGETSEIVNVIRIPKTRNASLVIIASFLACIPTAIADDVASAEERLRELGLMLPDPYKPFANYVATKRVGNLVFLGGHSECEEPYIAGKVGSDRTLTEGYEAAKVTALCLLASLKAEIGDLDKVVQIIKVNGMVNATEEFKDHSKVINGCSDLLIEVFGERGRHARAAVGMASLPLNLTVEIEMIVEVTD